MADVASILPPSSTPLERNLEQATSRLGEIAFPNATLWNPHTCPKALLPYLAWALGVDNWQSNWPESVQRAVIAATPAIKRKKGTVGAVRAAVVAMGSDMVIQEWWEQTPPGPPGTFSVILTVPQGGGDEASAAFADDVVTAVSAAKNARSHFTFTQGLSAGSQLGLYAYARPATYRRLTLGAP